MTFQSLEELDIFLLSLKTKEVTTTGNWTLAQILCHIGDSIDFFLSKREGVVSIPIFIQDTVGKLLFQKFLFFNKMDPGLPNPIKKGEPKNGDPKEELERVIYLSKIFYESKGPFNSHPVFGKLSKDEIIKLHLLHCSNHFSYIHVLEK